jgi:hemerythrin
MELWFQRFFTFRRFLGVSGMGVEWDESLSVGIGIIDDQHRKLIERVNAFADATESMDSREIENTINYLTGYVIQHFGAEELIMIRNRYPRFKEHRDEHSSFVKQVFDVFSLLGERPMTKEEAVALRDTLVRWVTHHIRVTDHGISETTKGALA